MYNGLIPRPTTQTVTTLWYTGEQVRQVRHTLRSSVADRHADARPEPLVSVAEVDRRAAVPVGTTRHAIHQGVIPGPTHRINRAVRYTESEAAAVVQAVAQWHGRPRPRDAQPIAATTHDRRRAAGLLSRSEVAQANGVAPVTHAWWERRGRIAPPTHGYPGTNGLYYDLENQTVIAAFYASRPKLLAHGATRRHARGLRSRTDVAKAAGISRPALCALIVAGQVPAPMTIDSGKGRTGRPRYYSAGSEFDAVVSAVVQAMKNKKGETK